MIKLIACDMDGTLLDENKHLPKNFDKLIEVLNEKKIVFAAASGRSWPALKPLFKDVKFADTFIYICDNGGNIAFPDGRFETDTIPRKTVLEIIDDCQKFGGIEPVLCCTDDIYYPASAKEEFATEITNFYINFTCVEDLRKIESDVIKIAVCDMKGSASNSWPVFNKKYGSKMNCVVSGKFWMDFMNKGIDKGNAMKRIMKELDIKPCQAMAFGDYFNDAPMLDTCKWGYVMENACDDMKKGRKLIAPPNTENGVIKVISRMFDIEI